MVYCKSSHSLQAPVGGKVEGSRDDRLSVLHDQNISANSTVRKCVRLSVRSRVQKTTVSPWFPLHVPGTENVLADKISRLHEPYSRHYLYDLLVASPPCWPMSYNGYT